MVDDKGRLEELVERLNSEEEMPAGTLTSLLGESRIEDIAEIFPHLKEQVRVFIFGALSDEMAGELLSELDEIPAMQILRDLTPQRIAAILNYLPPDEGADVIGFSDKEDHPRILGRMERDLAEQVQDLATHSPDTAGGVMTSEFISVHDDQSVRSALIEVKTSDIEEFIQNIYVLDRKDILIGVVSVRDLLQAKLNQNISEVMERDVISVPIDMDQEEVSQIISRYDFTSAPVVDDQGRLKGIVTFDDIMDVIEEESSEDIYRMAGEVALHPTQQPFHRRVMARMPWLLVTLAGTYMAALLIQYYETIFDPGADKAETLWTLLLCFIPMVGGMAGNVGIQSSTVMVRGLATGEVYPSIFTKLLLKELVIAAVIGLISGLLVGGVLVFFRGETVGYVVGLALFLAIVSAAFLGTVMPFACIWFKVDPAYASGPILTTMNDLLGFAIYFSIAFPLLH